ncbi:MAG TPA: hypothetical protein VFB73_04920 [Chloroflexota bacterium]|nr:hypothetical protein [Chloroflexota bacterium]
MPRRTPKLESESRPAGAPGPLPFGLSRGPGQRIELVFALRNGGMLAVTHDLGTPVTAETLDRYCAELREAVAAGKDWWQFADSWGGTGQRAFLQLSEVIGFTARPAR